MSIIKKLKREMGMLSVTRAGYSRKMASIWYRKTLNDKKLYKNVYSAEDIKKIHSKGYLCSTLNTLNLTADNTENLISNFDYIYLEPFNNSFTKWLQDMITTNRVLKNHQDVLRKVYFSIIERNGAKLILNEDNQGRKFTVNDIVDAVEKEGVLELRPSFWVSKRARYKMEMKEGKLFINDEESSVEGLTEIIEGIGETSYVVSEYFDIAYNGIESDKALDHYIKFWLANDTKTDSSILCAVMNILWDEVDEEGETVRKSAEMTIDLNDGSFVFEGEKHFVENWTAIKEKMEAICVDFNKLTYFTMSIAVKEEGLFKVLNMSGVPTLPKHEVVESLNSYLVNKVEEKKANRDYSAKDRRAAIKKSRFYKFTEKYGRKGIRPYMQALWMRSLWDDLWETKVSIFKKIWAWKRGFLSFRIEQYGLTEENYKNFLSDYDYHWLNRINNSYQIWVNDKTTFRYILEPFKEYIPQYYYSIFNRNGETDIEIMQDCPEGFSNDFAGMFELLKVKGKLALKPSAGTHGDGFYCMAYENDEFTINGDVMTEEEIVELIHTFKSYYLITEYINMHDDLKAIYPKSVNSIRVMVINEEGHDPKIMQAYMRIGSSKTGFTDNVGYGGICVMVDKETGELYNPETVRDHKFSPCPLHPDTNHPIAGYIPYWDVIKTKIIEICRYMCELEYLGFDIAVTQDGFQVIEINIHQDLHKVPTLDEEVMNFFRRKINNKLRGKGE
ncbi:MAG: sugar-transfer associated ATP-grasp domain-containing protein [Eubacterium sp.]|nr:sugar-transfer associated ATP-grasp domain-containing protein [Eubacterium sp.]